MTYPEAIRRLQDAASAAISACSDTTMLPNVDRQSLRLIAAEAARLAEQGPDSAAHDSIIRESSE